MPYKYKKAITSVFIERTKDNVQKIIVKKLKIFFKIKI